MDAVSDYVKVRIFPNFIDNFLDFSWIFLLYFSSLFKLDNLTLWNHNFHIVCIFVPDHNN